MLRVGATRIKEDYFDVTYYFVVCAIFFYIYNFSDIFGRDRNVPVNIFFVIFISGSNYLDVTGYFVACATRALSCRIHTRHSHQLYRHCVLYSISLEMSLNCMTSLCVYSFFQY
jgi:hypothetical protein